jgi:hypothetical protein
MYHVGLSRLYVTRIKKAFACDVFFPVISSSAWTPVRDEQVPHEEQVIYLLGYLVMKSQSSRCDLWFCSAGGTGHLFAH